MASYPDRIRLVVDFIKQEDGSYKNVGFVCDPTIIEDDADMKPRELKLDQTDIRGEIPNSMTIGQIKTKIADRIKEQIPTIS